MTVRVCFVIENLLAAGTERWLQQLVQGLDRHRIAPSVCLTDGRQATDEQIAKLNCPVLVLRLPHLKSTRTLAAAWRLRRFLKHERVDAVQVHHADPTYLTVPIARSLGIRPVVQTKYDIGYWLHGWDLRLHRVLRPWIHATLANCDACRHAAMEQERALDGEITVIDNGIDTKRFSELPPVTLDQFRTPRVGMLANLRPIKDPHCLVNAAQQLLSEAPSVWSFDLAGQGELFESLQQAISATGHAPRISLRGHVADVAAFLRDMSIVVLCSRSEGLPHALIEAMAAGRTVVATDVGGNRELIEHERRGLLIPPGDPASLAAALQRLRDNPEWAISLAHAGRDYVLGRYSNTAMIRTMEDLYEDLVGRYRQASDPNQPAIRGQATV
jgi:glycosyltransferase involved in cell wall biosynthesis